MNDRLPKTRRNQPDVQAHLTRLLMDGEKLSAMQAARRLSCCDKQTRAALLAMHDATLVYISGHERAGLVGSPWFSIYAWCGGEPKEDTPHPRRVVSGVPA